MNTLSKIAGGLAVTAVTVATSTLSAGASYAAGADTFNPRLEKLNYHQILVQADNVNRTDVVKLLRDRRGQRVTVETWHFKGGKERDFSDLVKLKFVGNINDYTLRVVDRDRYGDLVGVYDSTPGASAGSSTGGSSSGSQTGSGGILPIPGL